MVQDGDIPSYTQGVPIALTTLLAGYGFCMQAIPQTRTTDKWCYSSFPGHEVISLTSPPHQANSHRRSGAVQISTRGRPATSLPVHGIPSSPYLLSLLYIDVSGMGGALQQGWKRAGGCATRQSGTRLMTSSRRLQTHVLFAELHISSANESERSGADYLRSKKHDLQ